MNGRRIAKKTMRRLLITIFWMLLFVVVGVVSYKITILYYRNTGKYTSTSMEGTKKIVEATTDKVSVNAIFAVDGDDGKLKHLVLEVFDSDEGNLDFITIPTANHYGMSKELYGTLSKENANIPQIVQWANIPQYYSQATAYQYACMLLEESLGIHVSFYTLMPENVFAKYFEKVESTKAGELGSAHGYTLNEATKKELKSLSSSLDVEKELTAYYTKVQSNLSLTKRNTYLSAYTKIEYNDIGVYTLSMDSDTNQATDQAKAWIKTIVEP